MRHVIKRDNSREPLNFEQVTQRIRELCERPTPLHNVKYDLVAQHTIAGIFDGISTSELDKNAAALAQSMAPMHPEYGILASRLCVDNHRKETLHLLARNFKQNTLEIRKGLFYYVCRALYENVTPTGEQSPLISPELYAIATRYRGRIEEILQYDRDFKFDYMGFLFMQEKYLLRTSFDGRTSAPVAWPQHMFMRVAIGMQLPCPRTGVDDEEILAALPELREILSPATLERPVNWESVLTILKTRTPCVGRKEHPCYAVRRKLRELLARFNPSWNDRYLDCMRRPYEINWDAVEETYTLLSMKVISQATPTYYHAGTLRPQMASCFLLMDPADSLDGISRLWNECAEISKTAGGLGSHHHNIRARNSYIRSTNGRSNGLPSMLRVINAISVYVDQGGQKRPGSHAVYLEPWHADIVDVVNLKRNLGNEHERARQLFYAIWIPDEFIRCLRREFDLAKEGKEAKLWYLMCPAESCDLSNYYDEDFVSDWVPDSALCNGGPELAFTRKYRKYISAGRYRAQVSATELWKQILEVIIETGVPYIMFKDSVNRKSNHKHLGTIKSSNLCTEIVEFSNPEEIAVCNLTSLCLPEFVHERVLAAPTSFDDISARIDWVLMGRAIRALVRNMNDCIDHSYYPNEKCRYSNMRHRPLSIGVQGLADMCVLLRIPFDGELARQLNFYLFEFIYYKAVRESMQLAKERGAYQSFAGSPLSQGLFHHDLWVREQGKLPYEPRMPWDKLRAEVVEHGTLNSMFVGLMPTSSTSDINGLSACFEPYPGMVFKRRRGATEVQKVNPYLAADLSRLGLWTIEVQDRIFASRHGSIAEIDTIPREIRDLYKTAWDINWRDYNALAVARSPFIDQSQSLSQFIPTPTISNLTRLHYYNWLNGAKTSSYYTRRLPVVDAQKVQLAPVREATCPIGCDSCGA